MVMQSPHRSKTTVAVLLSAVTFAFLFIPLFAGRAMAASSLKSPAGVYGKIVSLSASGFCVRSGTITYTITVNRRTKYYNAKNKLKSKSILRKGDKVTVFGMFITHTYRITDVTKVSDLSRK